MSKVDRVCRKVVRDWSAGMGTADILVYEAKQAKLMVWLDGGRCFFVQSMMKG